MGSKENGRSLRKHLQQRTGRRPRTIPKNNGTEAQAKHENKNASLWVGGCMGGGSMGLYDQRSPPQGLKGFQGLALETRVWALGFKDPGAVG